MSILTPSPQTQLLQRLRQTLRPGQRRMADWQSGTLAISAVPGSGKSTGMAIAAAILLAERYFATRSVGGWEEGELDFLPAQPQGQLLLVTFTRSAVANLKSKIRQYLRDLGVPPQGFMVQTLHGLALHIATRHPELSGLDFDRLMLISPNQSNRLIRASVEDWIKAHPKTYQSLIEGRQFDGEDTERLRRQSILRTEVLPDLAQTAIHEAKSSGLLPANLRQLAAASRPVSDAPDYAVLAIAAGLYERYQSLLQQRGFIDYDDMILAALHVLQDGAVRQFWQQQFQAVFEDEAQDSSPLQTRLLQILAAPPSSAPNPPLNLVRVGDPNQAINSTFTPADPIFFGQFCAACQQTGHLAEMDQAGRSSPIILQAANFMLDWVNQHYAARQRQELRLAQARLSQAHLPESRLPEFESPPLEHLPFRPQHIQPVGATDPQPDANPDPEGAGLEVRFPPDVQQTVNLLAQRVAALLSQEPEARAAVLVRENRQGRYITELLRHPEQQGISVNLAEMGIAIYDVGEQDRHSHVPSEMLTLLQFLDRPHSPDYLKAALQLLQDRQLIPAQDFTQLVSSPEQFLYPSPLDPPLNEPQIQARRYCTGLLKARVELPHYQLIPFVALTLHYEQAELATADKLAHRIALQTTGDSSMSATLDALHEIIRSERFEPVETDDLDGRYMQPGQLTIITMHKAKGLDWDFVFIPFLHEQLIPGSLRVMSQAQFLGDFNLSEVARVQIRSHLHGEDRIPDAAAAWNRAAALKISEEYRLLYVAMTRARRLLWMSAAHRAPFTWSKPENLDHRAPCPVLPALVKQFPQALSRQK
ncbi:MAG: ATP-dependent helicase [Pegethrix bostrychoides GSE-TBD4-15B]|jgi:DNA helicase-2/ATP-dependent DNA helicase PcrA|uniref:DNA 3'-5' helicase n=1 Tax=Pegethrix bostrychoides GSE-TBD4-15B TaxID=2839662 RepID=A0A951P9P6_9CYAN|nr:ATP-dependent helicase [Pegethrix bostrychoides GSE-TBD4-15B]